MIAFARIFGERRDNARNSRGVFLVVIVIAGMAELADAPDLGSGGRPCRFESCCPQLKPSVIRGFLCIVSYQRMWYIIRYNFWNTHYVMTACKE